MSRTRTPRTKRSSARVEADRLARQRQQEVLGLLLMALAVLVGLAIVSYDARDLPVARGVSWLGALWPQGESAHNWLGLIGAKLAHALVPGFLGYLSLALCLLVLAWGYVLFRQREVVYLPLLTGVALVGTVLAAALVGWFAGAGEVGRLWAGALGLGVAGWMKQVFGAAGSLILLLLGVAILGLVALDRDIQITLDRVEATLGRLRSRTGARWQALREAGRARAEARAARRAERVAAQRARARETPPREIRPEAEPPERRSAAAPPRPDAPLRPVAPARAAPPSPAPEGDDEEALLDEIVARHAPVRVEPAVHVQAPPPAERGDLEARRRAQTPAAAPPFVMPPLELLDPPDPSAGVDLEEIEENKQILLEKLETYNVQITELHAVVGPTVTRYELTPAPGVRISRITALADDLAMAMAAPGIRIQAPIPGKSAIGVEIPNRHRELVRLRSTLGTAAFADAKAALPIPLGKNIQGEVHVEDLTRMPHLLIAGATGAGKSVGLNAMIVGLLYACRPEDLKFVMIDPKKIELGPYQHLLDHYIAMPENAEDPVITDFRAAAGVLKSCEREMEHRYDLLAEAGVRGIREYNARVASGALRPEDGHRHLPYVVVIVDELADLMMTSGKEVEPPIARLAQMARAVGIHLILATQRPSVDVITGLIKANFPSRIAYQVASKIDSRTILDGAGAEQLVGNGDLLYMNGSRMVRLQGPYVSNEEIERVVAHVARQPGSGPYLLPPLELDAEPSGSTASGGSADDERDEMFEEAARAIVRSQQGSVSLLQRKLSIGYTRAARIVDQLEDAGIVGPFEGSKARAVLVSSEAELEALLARNRAETS